MISRRGFIRGLLGAALYIGASGSFASAENDAGQTIRMYNTHTRESISVAHRDARGYIPEALDRINHFLRCHYNNEVHPIDPALIDLLCKVDRAARRRERAAGDIGLPLPGVQRNPCEQFVGSCKIEHAHERPGHRLYNTRHT